MEETGYESRRTSKTELFVLFFACHVILMVHTKSVSSHILQIARFFSRFIEDRATIYSKCFFSKRVDPGYAGCQLLRL